MHETAASTIPHVPRSVQTVQHEVAHSCVRPSALHMESMQVSDAVQLMLA